MIEQKSLLQNSLLNENLQAFFLLSSYNLEFLPNFNILKVCSIIMPLKQIWKITVTTIHDDVTVRNKKQIVTIIYLYRSNLISIKI